MGRPSSLHTLTIRKFAALSLAALALLGCTGFQMSGPQSTLLTEGPVARMQTNLFYVTLWVTCFIFVTVGGVLAYAQIKFRARPGDDDTPPEQSHGHPLIEMGLIVGSTLLLVIIAIPTVKGIAFQEDTPDRENALVVKVTGYQWWFKFEYPELGIVTANEMVIPTDRPVHIELRTIDVIHSFWVPRLAGKKDLIPNRANHMWLQADQAGYYWAQCAEYCGESHANMKFRVVSLEPTDFAAWSQRQLANARTVAAPAAATTQLDAADTPRFRLASARPEGPTGASDAASPFAHWQMMQAEPAAGTEDAALIARGHALFQQKSCGACHTVRGHDSLGNIGPDLTHFGSRTTIAAAVLDNTTENLHRWLADPNGVKPGNIMWKQGYLGYNIQLTSADVDALVAYLHSLK